MEVASALAGLEKVRDHIEARFREIEAISLQLALDGRWSRLGGLRFPPTEIPDFYNIIEGAARFPAYSATNSFAHAVYVVLFDPPLIVGHQCASTRIRFFYDAHIAYRDMSFDEWYDALSTGYHASEVWPALPAGGSGDEQQCLTFVQSLPVGERVATRGAVIILVRQEDILDLAGSIPSGVSGWFALLQGERVLASQGIGETDAASMARHLTTGSGSWHRDEYFTVHTALEAPRWSLVAGIPRTAVFAQADRLRRTFVAIVAAAILMGVLVSLGIASRERKPVLALIARTETLERLLEKTRPVVTGGVLERLLKGTFATEEEVLAVLPETSIRVSAGGYIVALFRVTAGAEDGDPLAARLACMEEIPSRLPDAIGVHATDQQHVAAVLPWTDGPLAERRSSMESTLRLVVGGLRSRHGVVAACGVGRGCRRLLDISASLVEAGRALGYGGNTVTWFDDLPTAEMGFYYPIEEEVRLINSMRSGNLDSARSSVMALFKRNFESRSLCPGHFRALAQELAGTIMRVETGLPSPARGFAGDSLPGALSAHLAGAGNPEELLAELLSAVAAVCARADRGKRSRNERLIGEIIGHIERNYADPGLGLTSVADAFGMSEKYLSDYFKEHAGTTFSSHLNEVRMRHAQDLLEQDHPVAEVASRVGYGARSFSRAFRRTLGVSPSEYRQRLG